MVKNKTTAIIELFCFEFLVFGSLLHNEKMIVLSQLISLLIIIYKVRRVQLLLLISIFFTIYIVPVFLHYYYNIGMSMYITYNSDKYYYMVLLCQSIFLNIFSIVLVEFKNNVVFRFKVKDNALVYYICLILIVLLTVLGRSGDSIFDRGGYGKSGDTYASAIFEYSYIFYILAYLYSGENENKYVLLKIVALFYSIWGLLFGARIEILAMMILVFVLFYQNKFKTKTLIIMIVIAYIAFSAFGFFRSNLNFSFSNIFSLYGYSKDGNLIVNNETEVYYTSSVILASIDKGFCDLRYRLVATINYFVRFIIPSSLLNQDYNVVPYLQKKFSKNGGGGFFSAFMFFYFGYLGVVVGAAIIAKLWNKIAINNSKNKYQLTFVLMLIVMSPRWFAYSPESIIKIPLYTVFIYWVVDTIQKVNIKHIFDI